MYNPSKNNLLSLSLTLQQFEALKKYIEDGGSVLVLMGEGGENRLDTNINFFLEEYGVMVNSGMLMLTSKQQAN